MTQNLSSTEKYLRFGCGSLLGFFVIFVSFAEDLSNDEYTFIIIMCLLNAIVFGTFAIKKGNRFWYNLKKWFQLSIHKAFFRFLIRSQVKVNNLKIVFVNKQQTKSQQLTKNNSVLCKLMIISKLSSISPDARLSSN